MKTFLHNSNIAVHTVWQLFVIIPLFKKKKKEKVEQFWSLCTQSREYLEFLPQYYCCKVYLWIPCRVFSSQWTRTWAGDRERNKVTTKTLTWRFNLCLGHSWSGKTWKRKGRRFRYNMLKHFQTMLCLWK